MTRRELRENVFKMLFRVEFFDAEELSEQLVLFGEEVDHVTDQDFKYIADRYRVIYKHLTEIDEAINEVAKGWKTTRMGKVDLALIRLAATVLNIILDIVFVSRFQMGVAGVAYATVIAQAVSAILCFWKLLRMTDIFDFKFRHLKMKKKYTLEIIRLGLPSGITQAIFSMAMVIVQSLTNSFGEMVIAANVIIMRVDGFAMMPNFSFGTAMTTYAGQNVGAHRMDRVEQGARQGTAIALGTSAVITLLILVFGKNLMAIFTDTSELVTLSANMMKILAVGYLAMAITQSLSGVMRGAGDTMTPMWISMITTVVIRVPLAYGLAFLTRTPELPNGRYQVLWISLLVCWCMGALLPFLFYKRGNWKKTALTANTNA